MQVNIQTIDGVTVVGLVGEIDAKTSKEVQDQVLPLAQPGARILLDMSQLSYMSSAGLRTMLLVYRSVSGQDGRVILYGLSDELQEVMSATGFLNFFTQSDSYDAGIEMLRAG